MVKRIVWTRPAEIVFTKILQFYIDRNGNKQYSRKIVSEVKGILNILKKQPFLGSPTENKDIRVFITRNYKLFYKIESSKIIVILIWHNLENPDDIERFLDLGT
jgi:toxin YoeB